MAVLAAPEFVPSLTATQFSTVYNLFSLVIASMLFTAIFLLASQKRVAPRYRQALVREAAERFALSARGYHRVLKLARTIADLDGASAVRRQHLAEALAYRTGLERAAVAAA